MIMKDFSNEELRFHAVWSSCSIPSRLAEASFDSFKPDCPEKEQALIKCRTFAENGIDNIFRGQGLFLQGPVGTGNYQRFLVMERF